MPVEQHNLETEAALLEIARKLSAELEYPAVILLNGELGAGKTTFARALIQALGYSGAVKSPTYTLLETYEANDTSVAHFDLYRLEDPEELHALGYREVISQADLVLIEWSEKGGELLPEAHYVIDIEYAGEGRAMHITKPD